MKTQSNPFRFWLTSGLMAACVLGFSLGTARAEDMGTPGQLSAKDFKYVSAAVQGGRMEVTLGQLAVQRASAALVREFAQLMIDDHQKANEELGKLLAQKGALVPDLIRKKDRKMTSHLQSLSGPAFDTAYIKAMVSDHKKDVKEFQKAADKSEDGDLKSWFAKTLPTLEEHLRRAQSLDTPVTVTETAN